MNDTNSIKRSRLITDLDATALKSNQINGSGYDFCEANELSMDKKGRYSIPYLNNKVKFSDLVEYEKEYFEFSVTEMGYIRGGFLTVNYKNNFVYTREESLSLIPYLQESYIYLTKFLENFENGKHIIYFSY